jgi:hypothetical protein
MVSYEHIDSMPVVAIPQNLCVSALVDYSSPYRDPATVLATYKRQMRSWVNFVMTNRRRKLKNMSHILLYHICAADLHHGVTGRPACPEPRTWILLGISIRATCSCYCNANICPCLSEFAHLQSYVLVATLFAGHTMLSANRCCCRISH